MSLIYLFLLLFAQIFKPQHEYEIRVAFNTWEIGVHAQLYTFWELWKRHLYP